MKDRLGDDICYPAILTKLSTGWLRSSYLPPLIAASPIYLRTHLNWGASYLVNDFYETIYASPNSSEEHLVAMGRWSHRCLNDFIRRNGDNHLRKCNSSL